MPPVTYVFARLFLLKRAVVSWYHEYISDDRYDPVEIRYTGKAKSQADKVGIFFRVNSQGVDFLTILYLE